jgi:hypothetical protein
MISAAARRPGNGGATGRAVPAGEVQVPAGDLADGLLVASVALVIACGRLSRMPRPMANAAKPSLGAATAGQWSHSLGGSAAELE